MDKNILHMLPEWPFVPLGLRRSLHGHRLLKKLGQGLAYRVYLAEAPSGKRVALKTPNPGWRRRFGGRAGEVLLAEAALLADLNHPKIRGCQGVYATEPITQVLSLLEGVPLEVWLHTQAEEISPKRTALALGILVELLDALGYLHARHVAHGDVGAGNVMLRDDGVVLFDLSAGIWPGMGDARLPLKYERHRTLAPPELYAGHVPSAASDICQAGLLACALVLGSKDMPKPSVAWSEGGKPLARWLAKRGEGVPSGVISLLGAMISPDPNNRMLDCAELRRRCWFLLGGYLPANKIQG